MSRKRKSPIISLLIMAIILAFWGFDIYEKSNFTDRAPTKVGDALSASHSLSQSKLENCETYRNCTLYEDKSNDGDSFRVKFTDGRTEVMRLYFVDTPESAFKTYRGGENNHRRIAQQAGDLGNITPEQAVEIGKKAKAYTLGILEKTSFTIHTAWDSPFNDKRYHAFVEVTSGGRTRFLHELLIERGLARIHTKGATLPDGTSESTHKRTLYKIESEAKSKKSGAWEF